MRKPKVGDVVTIRFYDHASQMPIAECEVIGRIKKIDRKSIELYAWKLNHADSEVCENNDEYYSIVRSTVIEMSLLR